MSGPELFDASAPATAADPANTFEPHGHPVRRALIALVALAALIVALWWSGLAAPRVDISTVSSTYDEQTEEASATIVVANEGPFAVKIVGVEAVDESHEFILHEQVEIEAGEEAETTLFATIDCQQPIVDEFVPFELVVETAVGIERRVSQSFGTSIVVYNCPRPG